MLLGLIAVDRGIAAVPRCLNSMTRQGVVFKEVVEGDQVRSRIGAAWQPSRSSPAVLSPVGMLQSRLA